MVLLFSPASAAQSVSESIKIALGAGSAKSLVKYFDDRTTLKINGAETRCNKAQAESLIKDFFTQHPAESFDYIHQGASPEGLKYHIGILKTKTESYRVVILLKKVKETYVVDKMDFSKN